MKMEITYDKEVDAMYIQLRKGEFHKNKKLDGRTILDIDKDGNILGIELLDASKRKISLPGFKMQCKPLKAE